MAFARPAAGGWHLWLTVGAGTGTQQFSVGFQANAIQLGSDTPIVFNTAGFHDYRIEATPGAGTFNLFVDNVSFASGGTINSASNRVFFGDGSGGANARAELTSCMFSQVPELSRMAPLLLGAPGFFARRRAGVCR